MSAARGNSVWVEGKNVVIHCLKHGSLSALGQAGANAVDIATAGGH